MMRQRDNDVADKYTHSLILVEVEIAPLCHMSNSALAFEAVSGDCL
jgi:hypothetical protein